MYDRTPEQYAIEHAEYLAKASERLARRANAIAYLSSEDRDVPIHLFEAFSEAERAVRDRIYEFRKRADRATPSIKSTVGQAAVDHQYFFRSMESCPVNVKVQLLNPDGIAVYGNWNGRDVWPKGWAPLPKIPDSMR